MGVLHEENVTVDSVKAIFDKYTDEEINKYIDKDDLLVMLMCVAKHKKQLIEIPANTSAFSVRAMLNVPDNNSIVIKATTKLSLEGGSISKDILGKLLCSKELLESVTVEVFQSNEEKHELVLAITKDGDQIVCGTFRDYRDAEKGYYVSDIESGVSTTGAYCLSFSVEVDESDVVDIPHSREIAIKICPDGKVNIVDVSRWNNDETGSYYVFDKEADDLVCRHFV